MRSICFCLLLCLWSITAKAQKDHFSLSFEVGSGYASHNNVFRSWGYHNMSLGGEYRFHRLFSADAALRFQSLDGISFGYSINNNISIRPYQRLGATSLALGPRLNVPIPGGMELSLAPRFGLLAQKIMQPIIFNGNLNTLRYYKTELLPTAELSLRWALWLNRQSALEFGAHYSSTLGESRRMTVARDDLNPAPDVSDISPSTQASFEESTSNAGTFTTLSFSVGIRTRLGQKAAEKPRIAYAPFEWGMLVGSQLNLPNFKQGQMGSGIHFGLFGAYKIRERLWVQVEPQVKYGPARSTPASFEDYIVTPVTYGKANNVVQIKGLTCLELPVLLKFVPNENSRGAWLLGVRPSANFFKVNEDDGYVTAGAVGLNTFDALDTRKAVQKEDIGFSIGHEYALSRSARFSIRYTQGLFDLTYDNFFGNSDTYTNSDLQASLRLLF